VLDGWKTGLVVSFPSEEGAILETASVWKVLALDSPEHSHVLHTCGTMTAELSKYTVSSGLFSVYDWDIRCVELVDTRLKFYGKLI
jgi:hypothetical protein